MERKEYRAKLYQTDTSKPGENPVMRAPEVRKMLGIGKNTLYEWCNMNLIPHKRVGRLLLFSRQRIYKWLEENDFPEGIS